MGRTAFGLLCVLGIGCSETKIFEREETDAAVTPPAGDAGGGVVAPAVNPIEGIVSAPVLASPVVQSDPRAAWYGGVWSNPQGAFLVSGVDFLYRIGLAGTGGATALPMGSADAFTIDRSTGDLLLVNTEAGLRRARVTESLSTPAAETTPISTRYDPSTTPAGIDQGDGRYIVGHVVTSTTGSCYTADIRQKVLWLPPGTDTAKVALAFPVPSDLGSVPSPWGVALAPDERTLYVAFTAVREGLTSYVNRYPIREDGSVDPTGVKVVDLPGEKVNGRLETRVADMDVDAAGNLYVGIGSHVRVFRPSGEAWGSIELPPDGTIDRGVGSFAFGGSDRLTLFITGFSLSGMTAPTFHSVTVKVPGR